MALTKKTNWGPMAAAILENTLQKPKPMFLKKYDTSVTQCMLGYFHGFVVCNIESIISVKVGQENLSRGPPSGIKKLAIES